MAASGVRLKTLPAITVAVAGTAVPLVASPLLVYSYALQSLDTNTGLQYVGDVDVDSTNGIIMRPGDVMEGEPPSVRGVDQFDISKIYVDSSVNNTEFRVVAWIRE